MCTSRLKGRNDRSPAREFTNDRSPVFYYEAKPEITLLVPNTEEASLYKTFETNAELCKTLAVMKSLHQNPHVDSESWKKLITEITPAVNSLIKRAHNEIQQTRQESSQDLVNPSTIDASVLESVLSTLRVFTTVIKQFNEKPDPTYLSDAPIPQAFAQDLGSRYPVVCQIKEYLLATAPTLDLSELTEASLSKLESIAKVDEVAILEAIPRDLEFINAMLERLDTAECKDLESKYKWKSLLLSIKPFLLCKQSIENVMLSADPYQDFSMHRYYLENTLKAKLSELDSIAGNAATSLCVEIDEVKEKIKIWERFLSESKKIDSMPAATQQRAADISMLQNATMRRLNITVVSLNNLSRGSVVDEGNVSWHQIKKKMQSDKLSLDILSKVVENHPSLFPVDSSLYQGYRQLRADNAQCLGDYFCNEEDYPITQDFVKNIVQFYFPKSFRTSFADKDFSSKESLFESIKSSLTECVEFEHMTAVPNFLSILSQISGSIIEDIEIDALLGNMENLGNILIAMDTYRAEVRAKLRELQNEKQLSNEFMKLAVAFSPEILKDPDYASAKFNKLFDENPRNEENFQIDSFPSVRSPGLVLHALMNWTPDGTVE